MRSTRAVGLAPAQGSASVAFLALILFSYSLGSAFLGGMVPLIARKVGMPDPYIGSILSAASLLTILAAPLWGILSDRVGRRPILLTAPLLAASGPLFFAVVLLGTQLDLLPISQVFVCILLARGVQAGFGAALAPVGQAYIADITGPGQRLAGISLLGVFTGIGSVCGSAVIWGASLDFLSWNLLMMSALAALVAVAAYRAIYDTVVKLEVRTPLKRAKYSLPLWRLIAIGMLCAMGFTMIVPILALRVVDKLGFPLEQATAATGSLLTTMSFSMLLSQLFLASFGRNIELRKILAAGCVLAVVALFALVASSSVNMLIVAAAAFGTANGLIIVSGVSAASLGAEGPSQGQVMGWSAGARALGMSGGPIAGTFLYQMQPDSPFWASLSLFCASLLLQIGRSRN